MKVYTKTGDKGTSSLYNGERRHKTDGAFQALGDVDELNSLCGVAREFLIELDSEKSEQVACGIRTCASCHCDKLYGPGCHRSWRAYSLDSWMWAQL